jgi:hypothetical protein
MQPEEAEGVLNQFSAVWWAIIEKATKHSKL